MLHSGYMLKLGEGPINYDWNSRFFVLDSNFYMLTSNLNFSSKSRAILLQKR